MLLRVCGLAVLGVVVALCVVVVFRVVVMVYAGGACAGVLSIVCGLVNHNTNHNQPIHSTI